LAPTSTRCSPRRISTCTSVLDHPADRGRGRLLLRRVAGSADAEASRRLSRNRHAGLRRDHPDFPQQSVATGQPDQRSAGHHADRPVPDRRFNFATRETIFGLDFNRPVKYYYFLVLLLVVIIVINLRLQDSRIGRAWEAIREDEIAARAMGINTRNLKLLAFAMARRSAASPAAFSRRRRASSARRASCWWSRSWFCRWSCWAAWATSGA